MDDSLASRRRDGRIWDFFGLQDLVQDFGIESESRQFVGDVLD
jgi:hypothetical protein